MSQYSTEEYEEINALNNYTKNLVEGLENSTNMTHQLKNNIVQQENNIQKMENVIDDKNKELRLKIQRSMMQEKEIEYKKKLIATRNRMLQLSQEKNIYKTKVIYTLLAITILVVSVMLALYINFSKK